MIRVLITGGAGYIGSRLVPKLLRSGHQVTVIDNYMYRQHSLLDCCSYQSFEVIRSDVRDEAVVKKAVAKADVIIPLAAIVGMPACKKNPKLAVEVNYEAVRFIARNKSKDQLLIYPNTNSGYGQGEGAVFTEESELNPISVYGITKVEAEKAVLDAQTSIVFRLATVFGVSPKMRLDLLVNDFTYRAWSDGYIALFEPNFKRNYVYVGDVARLFKDATLGNLPQNNVYNYGLSSANLSKLELCNMIKQYFPEFEITVVDNRKDPDQRNYIVSNEKIDKLGFGASTSVFTGVEELIKSFSILHPSPYTNL